jgi:hypothetical protein
MQNSQSLNFQEMERLFLDYVVEFKFGPNAHPSPEIQAEALLYAIEYAFLPCGDEPLARNRWVTDGAMVERLAVLGSFALKGSLKDQPEMVGKICSGFISTLVTAVRAGALRQLQGKPHFRCFPLPDWFEGWAMTWCDREEFHQPEAGESKRRKRRHQLA